MAKRDTRRETKRPGPNKALIAVASAAAAIALAYAGITLYGGNILGKGWSHGRSANAAAGPAVERLRVTLNPDLFDGEARRAYEIAEHHPKLLAKLHCYCGCERHGWMHNLLDCYRTMHASHCPICMGEAIEAERLAKQGVPLEKIREMIRARFDHGE